MEIKVFGSEFAPVIRDIDRRVSQAAPPTSGAAVDLIRLFGLDRKLVERRLVCRWHRDSDGRITCHWEPDIVPIPQR